MSKNNFIESIVTFAKENMKATGILASVTIAQACLESGYGTSSLATEANNLFGMKAMLSGNTWASEWDGTTCQKETKEQDGDGNEQIVVAYFRTYASVSQSIKDHGNYLRGAMKGNHLRYAGISGCRDYRKAAQIIKDGGYATDINYVDKLCSIIESHNLTQYDSKNRNLVITDALLTISNYNRPGTVRKDPTTAVACHYVGNPGTTAINNRNYFEHLSVEGPKKEAQGQKATKASCHYMIGLDGEILRLIPEEETSWCTNEANSYTISIEACHPDSTGKFTDATYQSYVELCADLCVRWGLNPLAKGLIRHYDVTQKKCPLYFVDHPEAWEQFKQDVANAMSADFTEKKSGWVKENGGWRFYLGDTGNCVKNDWYKDGDNWYWFDGAGMMIAENWKTDSDGKWYYMASDGAMAKNEWAIWKKELYRLTEDGSMFEGRLSLNTDEKGALQIFNEGTNELGYVKEGMILCLDGIRNTRHGHDESATYWDDLSENASNPVLASGGGMSFGDTYCHMQGGYWKINAPEIGWSPMTFEIVCQTDEGFTANTSDSNYMPGVAGKYTYGMFRLVVTPAGEYAYAVTNPRALTSMSIDQSKKIVFSVITESITESRFGKVSNAKMFVNSGAVGDRRLDSACSYKDSPIHLGKTYTIGNSALPWFGKIYSVRIYNRELSQEELKYNYMIDQVRFNFQ